MKLTKLWNKVKNKYYGNNECRYINRMDKVDILTSMIYEFLEELDKKGEKLPIVTLVAKED